MHASQHCTTLRDPQRDLISSRGFESRLSVTVVMWLMVQLGIIRQSHSQTVQKTLDTADVIVGLRVSAAAQLGDLLHNLSAALTSDGVFVCNLLIKSVIAPSISRVELANCGMRGASWESVVRLHHQLRSVVGERRCLAQGVSDNRSTSRRTTLFQML